jgi:hypothetical protein
MPANIGTFSYFCPHHSSAMFARKIFREYQSLLAFQLSQRIQLQNLGLKKSINKSLFGSEPNNFLNPKSVNGLRYFSVNAMLN